jgi:ribosomal subunit interface protein
MGIPVKFKKTGGTELTEAMRELIESKVQKLAKVLPQGDTTVLMEVELETLSEKRGGFRVELNLSQNGEVHRAEAKRPTVQIALDAALEDLRRGLRREKTKRHNLVRRGAAKIKDFFRQFPGL